MTKTIAVSAVMLSAPFLWLAACYARLPVEIGVFRSPIAGVALSAPSPCT